MSMDTEVGICNMALSKCGVSTKITSLSDGSLEATVCNERYPDVRDTIQREHVWNFCVTYAEIATADVTAPTWYWTSAYSLPSGCLRILAVETANTPYELTAGRKIYTNATGALKIKYLAKVTDVTLMDATFKDALATRLASEICMSLTRDPQRTQFLYEMYLQKMADARYHDSSERSRQPVGGGDHLEMRLYGPEAILHEPDI